MIDFYSAPTPNCQKVAILLEETGIPYETHEISLPDGKQKDPAFLAVNPNGRVPAIVDRELGCTIWESGAILIHLAEKVGRFLPSAPCERAHVMQWLMFQMSGIGPSQGGANVFGRYVPDKIPWVIERYRRETTRLYGVLDDQLARQPYAAGDYSIADMALYPWFGCTIGRASPSTDSTTCKPGANACPRARLSSARSQSTSPTSRSSPTTSRS